MSTRYRLWLIAVTPGLAFLLFACSSAAGPPAYEGFHDATNCQVIWGWVWDQNRPDAPLSVQISDGSTPLATVMANLPRPDLVEAGKGKRTARFSILCSCLP